MRGRLRSTFPYISKISRVVKKLVGRGTETFKGNGEEYVTTTSAHQEYIQGPNDNDESAFRTTKES